MSFCHTRSTNRGQSRTASCFRHRVNEISSANMKAQTQKDVLVELEAEGAAFTLSMLTSSRPFLQREVERVVPALHVGGEDALGVVGGRDDLLHVVGDEAGVGRGLVLLAGLPVPDDLDAVPAELGSLGGRERVFAFLDAGMNGGTPHRFALGQEENAAAVDGLAIEGDSAPNGRAFAAAAGEQAASQQGQPERGQIPSWPK